MNEIFPGLWIGSCPFKENAPNLLRFGIKSILTLDAAPLSDGVFDCFNRKFIRLLDEPSQDVLDILEEALDFIDLSLTTGGILVHCAMGVSRSATIVIAYVMRKNKLSYDSALEVVMKKRLVYPNIGFVNQLKLFEVMKWKVDRKSPVYMQYASIRTFRGSNIAYNRTDPSTTIATRDPVQPATFKCRKCSSTVPVAKPKLVPSTGVVNGASAALGSLLLSTSIAITSIGLIDVWPHPSQQRSHCFLSPIR
ncbi:hypothetical protein CRM22_000602 [Opisthorchis felineus]|uniref:Protein-tyrosine-phosphatase n=1 Tax=Opisthorchis felineus TaxID=147828 RepID=A0A4V3SH63_OPIFE|nr:hypothetical protein CRM22_000602 [Opisthorchis felineus]